MTDWRKSQDGSYHACVARFFLSVRELPQSSQYAGKLQAIVDDGSDEWGQFVETYEEGMAWCDTEIDKIIEAIKRDRSEENRLHEPKPDASLTNVYGPGDEL